MSYIRRLWLFWLFFNAESYGIIAGYT